MATAYDEFEKACVSSLNTTDLGGYESGLDRHADGTLLWLLKKSQYMDWREGNESKILLVTGYAGCGKSVMSSYVMRSLTKHLPARALVCRFFCDRKTATNHDASTLLQALIFQIVNCSRRLLRIVRKASDRGGIQILRQFDALWDVFVQIASDSRVSSITVILDGIDTYNRRTQQILVDRISELIRSENVTVLKFFITSRTNSPALRSIDVHSGQVLRLQLEEEQQLIGEDVNLVIRQRLDAMVERGGCKPSTRDDLEKVLISKADRTFLWISLVIPLIEERLVLFPTDITSIANQIPTELALIYEGLLHSIPPRDWELVGRLLRMIVVSARLLDASELSILLTIAPEHRLASSFEEDRLLFDTRMIQAALGPLIRIRDSKISLIHQSLQEYLISLSQNPEHPLAAFFGVDLQRDGTTLVSCCMNYLALDEFKEDVFRKDESSTESSPHSATAEQSLTESGSPFTFDLYQEPMFQDERDLYGEATIDIAAQYKLFDYAAVYWASGFLRCNSTASREQREAALVICGSDEVRLANWLRYFWIVKGFTEPCPPPDPLIVAAYFGHLFILQKHLDCKQRQIDGVLWTCLYWAAREIGRAHV